MLPRRDLLRGTAAAAGAALAGCSALPFVGPDRSAYTDWIPHQDVGHTSFSARRPVDVADAVEDRDLGPAPFSSLSHDAFEQIAITELATGFSGSFEARELLEHVEDQFGEDRVERTGEYAGYDVYAAEYTVEHPSQGDVVHERRYALRDGLAVVEGHRVEDAYERVVDARRGATEQLVDASEPFDRLTAELGAAPICHGVVQVDPDTPPVWPEHGHLAQGRRVDLEPEESDVTQVFLFEDDDAVDLAVADDFAGALTDSATVTGTEADGSFAKVHYRMSTESVL